MPFKRVGSVSSSSINSSSYIFSPGRRPMNSIAISSPTRRPDEHSSLMTMAACARWHARSGPASLSAEANSAQSSASVKMWGL